MFSKEEIEIIIEDLYKPLFEQIKEHAIKDSSFFAKEKSEHLQAVDKIKQRKS